ncbi:serine/threonine-protein kinase [Streptomyces qinglanensis]|uniref:non-specific serine/threonine protein kinase n=1 Tax=Streptomyces qinglanensis TaxID=943816 RepID=A0A1H9VLW5_9ACTN|nr:serine/threonine-protein kinase [Streptomyces qinglanensis]SES22193.1 Serine/threonine protein kinase [Streptomyces qinglanensis]
MRPGRLIAGRYELSEPLGKGGMGQVWGAHDTGLGGRPVAVKLAHSERMASLVRSADPEELRRRFARECQVTAQLDHPGLVTVYDAGQDGEELYLVMQRLDGSDLADHLAEHEPYPWQWAVAVAAQLCSALAAVHAVGIVHRDLKPGNVMVRPDGRVVILDLGIASVGAPDVTRLTRTGALVGTPVYMAPEQATGGSAVGPAADLYALGVVLYELLARRTPFEAPEAAGLLYKKLHEEPDALELLCPHVPAPLPGLVSRLLDRDPARRPADAHEVHAALAPLLPRPGERAPGPPLDPTRPFLAPAAPWPPRRPTGPGPGPERDLNTVLEDIRRLLGAGRYAEVAALLGRALPAAVTTYGEGSPIVRTLRKQYATVLVDTGRYAQALPELSALLRDLIGERGMHDPAVAQLLQDEAHCRHQLASPAGRTPY